MSIAVNPTGPQSPASGTHFHSAARVNSSTSTSMYQGCQLNCIMSCWHVCAWWNAWSEIAL